MKNKKALYILVPLLVIVWGTIAYKIVSSGSSEKKITTYPDRHIPKVESIELDTFSLLADYKDPFLGKIEVVEKKEQVTPVKIHLPKVEVVTPWPEIFYKGLIKNQKSNKPLYLLQINGVDMIMKEGEISNNVLLQKAWKDSIQVEFQKKKKKIFK